MRRQLTQSTACGQRVKADMFEPIEHEVMPFIKLAGRVMLPHATRLLRLRADRVQPLVSALRGPRMFAVGVDHLAIRTPACRSDNLGSPIDGTEEPVCICRAVSVERLPQNGVQILLRGLARGVRVSTGRQHPSRIAYRAERYVEPATIAREHRCEELRQLLEWALPGSTCFPLIRRELEQANLGALCDLIADVVVLSSSTGRQLLAADDVETRSDLLLNALRENCRRSESRDWLTLVPLAN